MKHFRDNPSLEFLRFIPLINDVMGDHDYLISDYDKDGKTYWFLIDFFEGDCVKSLGSIHLQFCEDPLILANGSIKDIQLDIDLSTLYAEIMLRIKKFSVIRESMFHDVHLDFLEDDLTYSLQIESGDPLKLPKLADVDEVMNEIKSAILEYTLK